MIHLPQLSTQLHFPPPQGALSDPNGLLAFGGDLSVERLTLAYSSGIFPWFSHGEPILWWSPNPRGILPLTQFYCSTKLAKLVRQQRYQVSVNLAFEQVIDACASIPRNGSGTWITAEMIAAYKALHHAGHAHSIEVWDDDKLIGGLYGVVTGKLFCGESMFHRVTDCSKLAMYYLVAILQSENSPFIDCQMQNTHLQSLGCIEVSRAQFLQGLYELKSQGFSPDCWLPRIVTHAK
jgi:leucyl/phenylalanyl-tRNA--protein transferase